MKQHVHEFRLKSSIYFKNIDGDLLPELMGILESIADGVIKSGSVNTLMVEFECDHSHSETSSEAAREQDRKRISNSLRQRLRELSQKYGTKLTIFQEKTRKIDTSWNM